MYYQLFERQYGECKSSEGQISALAAFIRSINDQKDDDNASTSNLDQINHEPIEEGDTVRMLVTEDKQLIISVCTPMMRRVHKYIKHSGEMLFCDASGNLDRNQCRVLVLLTHSAVGGLPLGVLIVTSESEKTLHAALELYKGMLTNSSFFGRGNSGPQIIMTDDSRAERNALRAAFPSSVLLLCSFHVLQAYWRYLWDSKNGVPRNDRPHLFHLLKNMLYAESEDALQNSFNKAEADEVLRKYPGVFKYVTAMFARKSEWAVCCRADMPIRGNNTNNFCEAAMRVLKEQVLARTKAFNVQQLVDFIVVRMEAYYQRRCMDVANNRTQDLPVSKFKLSSGAQQQQTTVTKISDTMFEVNSLSSQNKVYSVDMSVGFCTCHMGETGGPCKHQEEVIKRFKLPSWNYIPVHDPDMRRLLNKIATGRDVTTSWFQSLHNQPDQSVANLNASTVSVQPSTSAAATCNLISEASPADSFDSSEDFATTQYMQSQDDEQDAKILHDFEDMFNAIKAKFQQSGDVFRMPMQQMLKSFSQITTDSHLASAMTCFGKYSGVALPSTSKKRRLVSNKDIGVQPAAKQRRLVSGYRHSARVGRPKTSSSKAEKGEHPLSQVSLPRKKAKHSLSNCVLTNSALGKTHTAK